MSLMMLLLSLVLPSLMRIPSILSANALKGLTVCMNDQVSSHSVGVLLTQCSGLSRRAQRVQSPGSRGGGPLRVWGGIWAGLRGQHRLWQERCAQCIMLRSIMYKWKGLFNYIFYIILFSAVQKVRGLHVSCNTDDDCKRSEVRQLPFTYIFLYLLKFTNDQYPGLHVVEVWSCPRVCKVRQ